VTAIASPWLTAKEAAAYCRMSLRTFNGHALKPEGSAGRRRLFTTKQLDRFLQMLASRHEAGAR
jgi:hypothetical protein